MDTREDVRVSIEELLRSTARGDGCRYFGLLEDCFEGHLLQQPLDSAFDAVQEEISQLRRYGADAQADAAQEALSVLKDRLSKALKEPLTPQQASELCGYSADHLRTLVREGEIENVGKKHAPRIRRGDLPMKPRSNGRRNSSPSRDLADTVIRSRKRGGS